MKKFLLLLTCILSAHSMWAIGPLRKLPTLNKALFKTPISDAVTRQTFAQLQASRQLASFTQAEKALLLTHTFIAENNRWPRTVIAREGQIIPKEQYTAAERDEVALGKLLRRTLETSQNTPIQIRETLENLKTQYAQNRLHIHTLNQLNRWLALHQTWPREHISHDGELTPQEQFEISLAQQANRLCAGNSYACPKAMVEPLRFIRASLDPSYTPYETEIRQERTFQLLDRIYDWLNTYHVWPQDVQGASSQERQLYRQVTSLLSSVDLNMYPAAMELSALKEYYKNLQPLFYRDTNSAPTVPPVKRPATEYELLEVNPAQLTFYTDAESKYYISQEYLRHTTKRLILWLVQYNQWPSLPQTTAYDPSTRENLTVAKPIQHQTFKEIQETMLFSAIQHATKADPGLFYSIYTIWKEEGAEVLEKRFLKDPDTELP